VKKFGTLALIAFLVWYVAKDPGAATRTFHHLTGFASQFANGVARFASGL